ncbi:MAG TPA: methylated-DNA--[protein]-cysteine S-methyltransferase [Chloroflexota bacterium]|nr:methylated-DNA--[protein]-cysteine S-methyltransferase [Chloroflexota bacterium]
MTETELIRELSGLRDVQAPRSIRAGALLGAGLADAYFPLDAPIGRVYVAHGERGLSAVAYAASAKVFERTFRAETGRVAVRQDPSERLAQTLQEWLRGDRRHKLRFDLRALGEFRQAVLFKALEIPYGQTRPYSWIAREIGRPNAVRAVGTALARNPVPLFIPCHRVVRSDGRLGQYSLIGPEAKKVVLEAEGVQLDQLEELAQTGIRYFGSDTTRIFCFPTCRCNKSLTERHRVSFASESQARTAGYRPCKVCRPAAA